MTIASTTVQTAGSTGNGATTQFSFTFPIADYGAVEAEDQIQVIRETIASGAESILARGTDYTVSVNGDQSTSPGGSITMTTAPSSAYKIWIRSNPSFLQSTDLGNQSPFNAQSIEDQMDQQGRQILWLKDAARRTPRLGVQAGTSFDGEITGDLVAGYTPVVNPERTGFILGAPSSVAVSAAMTPVVQAASIPEALALVDQGNPFVDIASASTTDLGAVASDKVRITGATTVTSFGVVAAGTRKRVRFAAALTITYNATSLMLPGDANIITAADDSCEAISLGSGNWYVANYQRARTRDIANLRDLGGVGDDATASAPAIALAESDGGRVVVPSGTYRTASLANGASLFGLYDGPGQIRTNDGNRRAPIFRAITAAPSSFGNHDSAETAFNGDLSKVAFALEYRITGAATNGQPTSGYLYRPEIYPYYTYIYYDSGHNHSTSTNEGRTAYAAHRVSLFHTGNSGDLKAFNATGYCDAVKGGATSFLANGAIVVVNGDMTAGAAGVYFNPLEFYLDDNGYDVAANGTVVNLDRGNATGALDCFWTGHRVQSIGAARVNAMHSSIGPFTHGYDMSGATLGTGQGAILLKEDFRIYGSVTNGHANLFPQGIALGDDYITCSSGGFWNIVHNGASIAQLQTFWCNFLVKVNTSEHYEVDGVKVLGNRATGWTADTGTAKRSTNATYSGTAEVAYTQATIQTLMNAVRDLSQTVKALKDDLITHGAIGA